MATQGMQIDVAELAGIIVEGVLYGIFLTFGVAALYILTVGRMRHSSINVPMVAANVLMLVLATTQLIVDTVNIFKAFIDLATRPERLLYLIDVTEGIFAAKHSVFFMMMLLGDSIVIWRAFVVWGNNFYVIILPALCALGSAAAAWQTIWAVRHSASASIESEARWGYACFSLSLAANAMATGLLAYRIWSHTRNTASSFTSSVTTRSSQSATFLPVITIVLESGALNAAYLLAYIIVESTGSHGLEVMASIATPLVGIIFSTVIIRAGIARQRQQVSTYSSGSLPMPVIRGRNGGGTFVEINTETTKWTDSRCDQNSQGKVNTDL